MDKLNICFIVLSLFIFGSVTVANGDGGLKSEKPVGDTARLAYQIKLYDGSCLQYDRIMKSLTGVPCDSYSNKQQFRNLPVDPDVEGRHENATSPKAAKIGIPENSAFKEHHIPNINNEIQGNNQHIIWKSLDFGQSGASHVALKLKSADVLSNLNGKVSVQVGDAPSVLLDPEEKEASNSTEENVLNFELKTLNGTQDVILLVPLELSLRDIVSVDFKRANSINPNQSYAIVWNDYSTVLTIDRSSKKAFVKPLSTGFLQKFNFPSVGYEQYKIRLPETGDVLEAQGGYYSDVEATTPTIVLSQVWNMERNENGWVIISNYNGKKCLTAVNPGQQTPLRLMPCDDQGWQTWQILDFPPAL